MVPSPPSEHTILSAVLHAGFLILSALSSATLGETPGSTADSPLDYRFLALFAEPAIREPGEAEEPRAVTPARTDADDREPVRTKCGGTHGGTMGDARSPVANNRYGVAGPSDNPDPHLASEPGEPLPWPSMLGPPLPAPWPGDRDSPTVPWGRDDALGNDIASARAGLWGEAIAMAFGSPGVGVGRKDLCESCGDSGAGRAVDDGTAPGGETGTESSGMGFVARPAHARVVAPAAIATMVVFE